MSLAPATRCTFVILALTILPNQFHCQVDRNGNGSGHGSRDSLLAESQMRIFTLTLLGLFVLILLGFLGEFMCLPSPRSTRRAEISDFLWAGCICCFCRISRAVESTSDGLDVYAPRTQSIVWPTLPLPQEAGRVLEMTFLHAPRVNCLCRNCCLARNSFCIENLNMARWILLLATSAACAHLAKADDNYTGITIYSCVHCKLRSLRRRSRMEAQRRLQLTNLRSEHIPNSRDCPCHGCILAREMLQGLIMHQFHELVEC
ncbi:GD25010 [Drosophila simulans]|uniref:GD25010 n=1 Tax=Drosophila simulans TaxID=7240 RepID=B4QAZ9_DROSI|nr:GD25010 [Drosophila simulans]